MIAKTQNVFGAPLITEFLLVANEGTAGVGSVESPAFLLEPGGQDYVGDNSYDLRRSDGNAL